MYKVPTPHPERKRKQYYLPHDIKAVGKNIKKGRWEEDRNLGGKIKNKKRVWGRKSSCKKLYTFLNRLNGLVPEPPLAELLGAPAEGYRPGLLNIQCDAIRWEQFSERCRLRPL